MLPLRLRQRAYRVLDGGRLVPDRRGLWLPVMLFILAAELLAAVVFLR